MLRETFIGRLFHSRSSTSPDLVPSVEQNGTLWIACDTFTLSRTKPCQRSQPQTKAKTSRETRTLPDGKTIEFRKFKVCEVLLKREFVAAIYPTGDGIMFMSSHLKGGPEILTAKGKQASKKRDGERKPSTDFSFTG